MRRLLFSTLLLALVVTTTVCGGEEAPPSFQPLPTPTVPPSFVTFTDESSLFSIAYPPEWELALSMLPDLEEITKDIMLGKQSNFPVGNLSMLFMAGWPIEQGLGPDVNIIAESLPREMSVNEYHEANLEASKEALTGFKPYSQFTAVVGDRESVITDSEFDLSSLERGAVGRMRSVQLTTTDGKVGWVVTCSIVATPSTEDLQTCGAVIRTFRLLQ